MNEDLFYDMLYTGSQIDKSEHYFEYEWDFANGKIILISFAINECIKFYNIFNF